MRHHADRAVLGNQKKPCNCCKALKLVVKAYMVRMRSEQVMTRELHGAIPSLVGISTALPASDLVNRSRILSPQ